MKIVTGLNMIANFYRLIHLLLELFPCSLSWILFCEVITITYPTK